MDIELKGIRKKFGSKIVLDQINLHLPSGQTHVLLGSSGSGKSTLLKMIAGVIRPEVGEVLLSGQPQAAMTQLQVAKQIGYVIQEGGLFPHLTAEDNVTIVSRILGWSKQEKDQRLNDLLDLVGLEKSILRRYPRELSGGQRQRIGIMRACFLNPEIMLLDEPLGALDPLIRAELQTELKRIFSRLHKTVVIVTHDLGEAAFFGDTITLLKDGRILQHGTFSKLLKEPADPFVTQFIGAQRRLYAFVGADE